MYTYKQLQCFLTIVEEGGFTLAADKLYMTQPAISWQIKVLEKEVGLSLIDRKERKLVLTEAGQIFYQHALTILNQYQAMEEAMVQFKDMDRGRLILGASTLAGEYFLPPLLADFSRTYPEVDLEMRIGSSQEIVSLLCEEAIQLGLVGFDPGDKHIWSQAYREDELICVAHPAHPLSARSSIKLSDLAGEKVLIRKKGSGTRRRLEEALAAKKIDLGGPQIILGSNRAILQAVQAGMGISWVSKQTCQGLDLCQLGVADFHIKRTFYIIGLSKRTLSPLAQAFHRLLEEA